jgi:hypothetical protein
MKDPRRRLRLFVCVKTRTDGRSCCAYRKAPIVLDELRQQIFERGETCSHIELGPITNVFVPTKVLGQSNESYRLST